MSVLSSNNRDCLSLHLITFTPGVPVNEDLDAIPQLPNCLYLGVSAIRYISHKQTTVLLLFLSQLKMPESSYGDGSNKGEIYEKMRVR